MVERYFEEGNEMLKRTLIAVAVVALMAATVQAYGPDVETGKQDKHTGFKIHPIEMDIFWPFVEYQAIDLCQIPVKMEVGIFVQVEECNKRKIILKQVDCGDIGKSTQGDWPCYKGCENVKIRSNFDIKLGLKKAKIGPILDKWDAYYDGDSTVDGASGWKTVTVCVKAWRAKLYEQEVLGEAGEKVDVGTVTITVKPNV
jgi:hypothetical protein